MDEMEALKAFRQCNDLTERYKRQAEEGDPRALRVAADRIKQCLETHTCANSVMCSKVLRVFEHELAHPGEGTRTLG